MRAQTMVAGAVVEFVRDPQEPLAGAELEGGRDGHRHSLVAPRAEHDTVVADRERGPRVVGLDVEPGPHRAGFDRR